MKRRILGFQRRVWWPKWTPASSSSLMPISVAKEVAPLCVGVPPAGGLRTRAGSARAGPRTLDPAGLKEQCAQKDRALKHKARRLDAASLYISVPVWPSGDWLPSGYIERAT